MTPFENTFGIYLFILLPFLLLLIPFYLKRENEAIKMWGKELVANFSKLETKKIKTIRIIFYSLSLISIFVSYAKPQWGEIEQKGFISQLDVIFLVDLSKSMNTSDIKPSRLERTKLEVKSLIEKLEDARMGIVVFSSTPMVLCPLTEDKSALNLLFEIADTSLLPVNGTDIGKGIEESLRLFSYDDDREKIIMIFSDGEDWGSNAFKSASTAYTLKVKIFSIGVGTYKGGIVLDEKSKPIIDPSTLSPAHSFLDSSKLKHIANQTDGRYFEISNDSQNLNELYEELKRIKRREYATNEGVKREEKFSIFALLSFFSLFLTIFLNLKINYKKFLSLFIMSLFPIFIFSQTIYKKSEKGRALFNQGDYASAVEIFREILPKVKNEEKKSILLFNLATSLLKNKNYQESVDTFYAGLQNIPQKYRHRLLYNLSIALYYSNRSAEALSILRDIISNKPEFEEAKLLYEWILKQKKEEPPPPDNSKEPPPPPPPMEELPPPPKDLLQDEISEESLPEMKPW